MKNDNQKTVVALLTLAVFLLTIEYYFRFYLVNNNYIISSNSAISLVITLIFLLVLIMFVFCRKLFLMTKQEQIIATQQFYIGHLDEMIGIIRAQRHDFVNHLQIVYTLLQMGEEGRALAYIKELCQEVRVSGELLQIEIPELTALLLAKTGIAVAHNITFNIIAESTLAKLVIKPIELAAIIGNLVDNAFEAVVSFAADQQVVAMKIFETPHHFVFEVSNPGSIPLEIRDKIFITGFSTKPDKDGHGIGLASVKHLVEKNHGTIVLDSSQAENTRFTVCFPKQV